MLIDQEAKIYKTYVVTICFVVALSLSGVFLGMTIRTRSLIIEELVAHSRAYFETIVATRLWNASYGGVYVEKKPGVQSNPFYPNPDLQTKDGRTFTIRNPAMMTREVAGFIGKEKDFSFHITSKKLINPNNTPDSFELKALDLFERGRKEVYEIDTMNNKKYFRFMGPLHIKKDCLTCHAEMGYKEGDVRGGISVTYNIDEVINKLYTNGIFITTSAIATIVLLLSVLWLLTKRLMLKISDTRKELEVMAITDTLTETYNRRYLMERFEEEFDRAKRLQKGLACMLLDVDRFKSINDKHGHQIGDEVLREIADSIKRSVRKYDIVARYGGEEFMVVSPETGLDSAMLLAERIRSEIKSITIKEIKVTSSIGVTTFRTSDENIDDIIRRADENLYAAKSAGRDCCRSS
ncbi:MAG: diguanylate cyclase [Nitrospirae bacterium]|nr:diguanylate cyclase [Nitrospirota bacterium]